MDIDDLMIIMGTTRCRIGENVTPYPVTSAMKDTFYNFTLLLKEYHSLHRHLDRLCWCSSLKRSRLKMQKIITYSEFLLKHISFLCFRISYRADSIMHTCYNYTETKKISNTWQTHLYYRNPLWNYHKLCKTYFCSKCDYNLFQYQILQNFICMECSVCHKMCFKSTKCQYFEHSLRASETVPGQFPWTLTYQRQFLDVIQSGFAVKNATRLDVIWMKRSSIRASFLSARSRAVSSQLW